MALVNCSECGKQISTDAATCPHCGKPQGSAAPKPAGPKSDAGMKVALLVVLLVAAAASLAVLGGEQAALYAQYAGLGAGGVAWLASAAMLTGSAIKRFGGGFVIGVGVVILSAITMQFCTGAMIGAR